MIGPEPRAFGWADWLVVAVYAAVLIGVGARYARRQRTTEAYFVGGRNKRPALAGLSLFASLTTIVTLTALPGEVVQNGPVYVCASLAGLAGGYFIVGWLLIPLIMRLPITSAYELLEGRLGRNVRLVGSLTFLCVRFVWMSLVLFTAATVLGSVTGGDPRLKPCWGLAIGAVATAYTLIGGIEAVMITGAVQFVVFMTGIVLTLASVTAQVGGVAAWWPTRWQPHWAPQPVFSLDPHVRVTVVGSLVYYVLSMVSLAGSDQIAIQRYLTTRDARSARRAYLMFVLVAIVIFSFLGIVGTAMLGFYRANAGAAPAGATFARNGDVFFPDYISHYLPTGISGLVVAALLASAMSGVGSGINSAATVISNDLIEIFRPRGRTEAAKVRAARWLALAIGAGVALGSVGMVAVRGDLLEVAAKTVNIFAFPMFELFFMAMFVPFATPFGAILGAVYGLSAAVLVAYWDVLTGLPGLSFLWTAPVATLAGLGAGCLLSRLPTRGRPPVVVGALAAAALAPLAAAFAAAACLGR